MFVLILINKIRLAIEALVVIIARVLTIIRIVFISIMFFKGRSLVLSVVCPAHASELHYQLVKSLAFRGAVSRFHREGPKITQPNMYLCVYIYICIVSFYIYIYTYIPMCVYIYIHIYICMFQSKGPKSRDTLPRRA